MKIEDKLFCLNFFCITIVSLPLTISQIFRLKYKTINVVLKNRFWNPFNFNAYKYLNFNFNIIRICKNVPFWPCIQNDFIRLDCLDIVAFNIKHHWSSK